MKKQRGLWYNFNLRSAFSGKEPQLLTGIGKLTKRVRPLKFTMCWRGIGLDSFDQAWELICQYCKTHISEVAYNTWLERLKPVSLDFERGVAIIEAPNKFHMSTVHSFYSKLLQDAFDNVFGGGVSFQICLPDEVPQPAPQPVRRKRRTTS
mgnify:CR=1 FL=1